MAEKMKSLAELRTLNDREVEQEIREVVQNLPDHYGVKGQAKHDASPQGVIMKHGEELAKSLRYLSDFHKRLADDYAKLAENATERAKETVKTVYEQLAMFDNVHSILNPHETKTDKTE